MTDVATSTGAAASGNSQPKKKVRDVDARRQRMRHWAINLVSFLAFIAVWWAITAVGVIKPLYLPSPGAVWDAFVRANIDHPIAEGSSRIVRGEQNYYLWEHLLASLQRIGIGVGGAIVFGVPLGLMMASVKWIGIAFDPYLNFLRSIPPLAYIGLLIVWFGIGDTSKVWLLFLAAFPPITMSTIAGVKGVKEDQVNAVLTLGASRFQALRTVMIPATMPDILTGIRVAVGFAWTTVVAAEIANGIPGIGGLAYQAGQLLQTPVVIASIIVIGITAILLDLGLKALELILVPWRGKA